MKANAVRAQSIVGTSKGRAKHDFYPTPAYVTEDLLEREKFRGLIWEPACGDGAISKVLEEHGHKVLSTDLIYRGYGTGRCNFLVDDRRAKHIITNPPYSLAHEFIVHALEQTSGKVAMFCKLALLEGAKRKTMFESSPLARVWVYSKRVTQWREGKVKQGTGMMAFAWFVWEHGYDGPPTIGWI